MRWRGSFALRGDLLRPAGGPVLEILVLLLLFLLSLCLSELLAVHYYFNISQMAQRAKRHVKRLEAKSSSRLKIGR